MTKSVENDPPPEMACLTEREYLTMLALGQNASYAQIGVLFEITADDVREIERVAMARLAGQ